MLRRIVVLSLAAALTLTTAMAAQAGEGKGKVIKLDSTANVVVLEDGTMYRMAPDTVILIEEKPVKFEALKPGAAVVIRSGEPVQFRDGQYIVITPSASPASR
jgi:ribosomal protein L14